MNEFLGCFPALGVGIRSYLLESLRSLHALDTTVGRSSLGEARRPGARDLDPSEYLKKYQWLRRWAAIAARSHEHGRQFVLRE